MVAKATEEKDKEICMKDVVQKDLSAGVEATLKMQLARSKFLVKNFTNGNIKVRLGDNTSYSVIGPLSYEVVFNNINNKVSNVPKVTKDIHVTADESGMVEVASID